MLPAAALRKVEDLADEALTALVQRKDTRGAIERLALAVHEVRSLRVQTEREARAWARELMDEDRRLRERIDRAVYDAVEYGEPASAEHIVQSYLADRDEETPGPDHYDALVRAVDRALAEEIPHARGQKRLEAAYPH